MRADGYVLLRWRVAPGVQVGAFEHRVSDGRVIEADQVHHLNHNRSDNRPENLTAVTHRQHHAMHAEIGWWPKAARLYESGLSTPQVGRLVGKNSSTVWRALRSMNVHIRSELNVGRPR